MTLIVLSDYGARGGSNLLVIRWNNFLIRHYDTLHLKIPSIANTQLFELF